VFGPDIVPEPDALDCACADVDAAEQELPADFEAALGRELKAVVEDDLFELFG
jgi:hypothetical protein